MPEKRVVEKAKKDRREGKAPSTAAGEFVHEEMEHIREGKHGARNAKQAIAIGLSKARRAGIDVPDQRGGSSKNGRSNGKTSASTSRKPSPTRSRATSAALKREPRAAASHTALARHAKAAAKKRSAADRSASAKKAAQTRKRK
jgi:hypothetical protein